MHAAFTAVKPFGAHRSRHATHPATGHQLIQPHSNETAAMEAAGVLSAANCGIVCRIPTWPATAAANPAPPGSGSHPDPHPQAAAAAVAARSDCLSVVQLVSARKWQIKLQSMCTGLHASSVHMHGCAAATGAECVLREALRCAGGGHVMSWKALHLSAAGCRRQTRGCPLVLLSAPGLGGPPPSTAAALTPSPEWNARSDV